MCRCCKTNMNGSDHCPECGCEEFEETCDSVHWTADYDESDFFNDRADLDDTSDL